MLGHGSSMEENKSEEGGEELSLSRAPLALWFVMVKT